MSGEGLQNDPTDARNWGREAKKSLDVNRTRNDGQVAGQVHEELFEIDEFVTMQVWDDVGARGRQDWSHAKGREGQGSYQVSSFPVAW